MMSSYVLLQFNALLVWRRSRVTRGVSPSHVVAESRSHERRRSQMHLLRLWKSRDLVWLWRVALEAQLCYPLRSLVGSRGGRT